MPPTTFPRTQAPMDATWPAGKAPLQSRSANSKINVRGSLQVGWRWSELFPAMDGRGADLLAELTTFIEERHRGGGRVLVRPWSLRVARSTDSVGARLPVDTAGQVSGAGQSGTSLAVTSFPANCTLKRRDYLTCVGVPYALKIMADVTLDGLGAGTVTIDPPIYVGPTQPANGAQLLLNGLLDCFIIGPEAPSSVNGVEWYEGISVRFEEAVPSTVLGEL